MEMDQENPQIRKSIRLQRTYCYPSDISREEFEKIRNRLENAFQNTKPREIDLYDVYCAILYVFKTGCPWSMLPSDFPSPETVYRYFRIWSEKQENDSSLLLEVLKETGRGGYYLRWTKNGRDSLSFWKQANLNAIHSLLFGDLTDQQRNEAFGNLAFQIQENIAKDPLLSRFTEIEKQLYFEFREKVSKEISNYFHVIKVKDYLQKYLTISETIVMTANAFDYITFGFSDAARDLASYGFQANKKEWEEKVENHFGNILKKMRMEKGRSIDEIARELCLSPENYSELEQTEALPKSSKLLETICSYFDTTVYKLLGLEERLRTAMYRDVIPVTMNEIMKNLNIPDRHLEMFRDFLSQYAESIRADLMKTQENRVEQEALDQLIYKISEKELDSDLKEYVALTSKLLEKRLFQGVGYGFEYGLYMSKTWKDRDSLIDDYAKPVPPEMI